MHTAGGHTCGWVRGSSSGWLLTSRRCAVAAARSRGSRYSTKEHPEEEHRSCDRCSATQCSMHMGTGEVQGVIGRHGWMLSPQHSSRHMASVLGGVGAGGVGAGGGGFGGGDAGGGGAGGGGDHVACAKNSDAATSGLFARFPKAFFCVLTNPFWGQYAPVHFSRKSTHLGRRPAHIFFLVRSLLFFSPKVRAPPLGPFLTSEG